MSDSRPEFRIALLGQGFMGKAHSNALAQVSRFFDVPFRMRLSLLCGRNREALERAARDWGWEAIATDWREAVERRDIDAFDIALPNYLHREAAEAAARAGKIVFCEKPLANTLADARAMVEAARNVPTMVWFNYRRAPAVAYAKQLIDEGRLGRIFHYRGCYQQQSGIDLTRPPSWKTDPAQAGHGVVVDLMSHAADLAMHLNGAFERVTALTRTFFENREVEDAAAALACFVNGSAGYLETTRVGVGYRNSNAFEIQGAKGMLRFDLEDLNRLTYFNADDPAPLQGARSILVTDKNHPYGANFWRPGHIIGYEHTFIAALGDFLSSLSRGETFHPNFEDGLRAQEVLEAVLQSADSGQWVTVEG